MTSSWNNIKCLVTGYGFVSKRLVRKLLSLGADITVIEKAYVPDSALDNNVSFINQDLRDLRDEWEFDYVFHLAAVANPGYAERNPGEAFEANVLGTLNLLRRVKVNKLLFFSSSSNVYGDTGGALSESSPISPINTYGVTKMAAEELIKVWRRKVGTPYAIVRFFTLYGPGSAPMYIIPQLCIQALRDKRIVIRDGSVQRDFLYVDDAIELMIKIANSGKQNLITNVGFGRATSIAELADTVKKTIGDDNVSITDLHERDPQSPKAQIADVTYASSYDWQPSKTLEEGLRPTIEYYRKALAFYE